MAATIENQEKIYFSIGEVAQQFGVSTSLIRFWESEFPHLRPRKNSKGDRRYTQKEIEALRQVYQLVKEKGFTLQGAKDFLNSNQDKKAVEALESLKNIRRFLVELRDKLPTE
jgi:DNA-binding transcriptional MerR regulator